MSWPTATIDTTDLDAGSDSPSTARADLLAALQAINNIIGARALADGVASLDSDGFVPSAQLSGASLVAALASADGAGSGLNADFLDGKDSTEFILRDGTLEMIIGTSSIDPWTIKRVTTDTGTSQTVLSLDAAFGGSPSTMGFGSRLRFQSHNSGQAMRMIAGVTAYWNSGATTSATMQFELRQADTVLIQLKLEDNHLEFFDVVPSGSPAAGRIWVYSKSGALYYKTSASSEVGPLGAVAAGGDHGALSGLSDDDHTQYLRTDGTRALTGELNLGTDGSIIADERAADPTTPPTGQWRTYFKAGGMYYIDDAGVVTGPLSTGGGGVTDHGALTGLSDNDHTQYVLRQPIAATVINDSGGDFDFRIEGDTKSNLFNLDAGLDQIFINAASGSGRLHVTGDGKSCVSLTADSGFYGVYSSAVSGAAFYGVATTGHAGYFARITTATAQPAVEIADLSDAQAALKVTQTGAGQSVVELWNATQAFAKFNRDSIVINDAGAVFDLRVEGDGATHLLYLVGANDQVCINTATPSGARLTVVGTSLDGITGSSTAVGKSGVVGTNTVGFGVQGTATGGYGIYGNTTLGAAGYFYRDATSSPGAACVEIWCDNVADNQPALRIRMDGTGDILVLRDGASSDVFVIEDGGACEWLELGADPLAPSAASGKWKLYFKAAGIFLMDDTGAVTGPLGTGGAGSSALSSITAAVAANSISNGVHAQVWQWSLAATGSSALKLTEATAASSGGVLLDLATIATSTAIPLRVRNDGDGSATGIYVTGGRRALSYDGTLTLASSSSPQPAAIFIDRTYLPTVTSTVLKGISNTITIDATATSAITSITGDDTTIDHNGDSDVTTIYGRRTRVLLDGQNAGTVAAIYGHSIEITGPTPTGVAALAACLRIAAMSNANDITTKWAILSEGVQNSAFLGGITVGDTVSLTASALLEIKGTTGALLLSRLTTTQRDALTAANGMLIYNTTTSRIEGYAGGAWDDIQTVPLSSLIAATATNSISNGNFQQTWQWQLTGTDSALLLTEPSASTGSSSKAFIKIAPLSTSTARGIWVSRAETGNTNRSAFRIEYGSDTWWDFGGQISQGSGGAVGRFHAFVGPSILYQTSTSTYVMNILGDAGPAANSSAVFTALGGLMDTQPDHAFDFTATPFGLNGVHARARSFVDTGHTCAGMAGLWAEATKWDEGVVTDAFALYAEVINDNTTGAITNGYGLYIPAFRDDGGGITNKWGIFQASSAQLNRFTGVVEFAAHIELAQMSEPTPLAYGNALYADTDVTKGLRYFDGALWREFVYTDGLHPMLMGGLTGGFTIEQSTADTNDFRVAATLKHTTSGTAAAGFGIGLDFTIERASGAAIDSSRLLSTWTDATNAHAQLALSVAASGTLTDEVIIDKDRSTFLGGIRMQTSNGSLKDSGSTSGTTGALSGATHSVSSALPANSRVRVLIRVIDAITGATSFHVGSSRSGFENAWGNGIAVADDTTTSQSSFVIVGDYETGAAAEDLVFTSVGGSFSGGNISYTIWWETLTAPTS